MLLQGFIFNEDANIQYKNSTFNYLLFVSIAYSLSAVDDKIQMKPF